MNSKEYRVVLSALRTKTAAESDLAGTALRELAGKARRGAGHVWDAANKGTQAMAGHLEAKGAPKIVSGAIHALPTAAAAYGGYKVLQGLSGWNRDRVLRAQMQMQGGGY